MSTELTSLPIPRGLAAMSAAVPTLFVPNAKAAERFLEFFTANIRNKNTRRAYYKAACRFSEWCEGRGLDLAQGRPIEEVPCASQSWIATDFPAFLNASWSRRHTVLLPTATPAVPKGGV